MKIASSDVTLASDHTSVEKFSLSENLRAWVGNQAAQPAPVVDQVSLSPQGQAAQQASAAGGAQDAASNDPRLELLIALVEALTGKKIHILSVQDITTPSTTQIPQDPSQAASQPASAGFGVALDVQAASSQTEQTDFSAQGTVRTADGQNIAFNLQLDMSSTQSEQADASLRLGDAARQTKDPLVINFAGTAAQLTSTKFSFDLNSDGKPVDISFVSPGSGFLALDKNGDGKIDNGSELFGPATGNGYQQLAALDQNGDHWIDENDPAFGQLRIWTRDANGKDQLLTLKEAGVGAIYLGNASTEFSLKDTGGALDGQVRSSSVYLKDDGSVGSTQQVDLAV